MAEGEPFKVCPHCGTSWSTLFDFVEDLHLRVNGYQASYIDPEEGVFFLTHDIAGCMSTMAVEVRSLRSMYNGPKIDMSNTGKETCPGFCLSTHELEDCQQVCNLHWVRIVLQFLRNHEIPRHLREKRR